MMQKPATIEHMQTAQARMMAGVARIEQRIGLNMAGIAIGGIMAIAIETMPAWARH